MSIQKILGWSWPFRSIWPIEKILWTLEKMCPIIIIAFHVIKKMLFMLFSFWLMYYNTWRKVANVNYQITLLIRKYEMNLLFWSITCRENKGNIVVRIIRINNMYFKDDIEYDAKINPTNEEWITIHLASIKVH